MHDRRICAAIGCVFFDLWFWDVQSRIYYLNFSGSLKCFILRYIGPVFIRIRVQLSLIFHKVLPRVETLYRRREILAEYEFRFIFLGTVFILLWKIRLNETAAGWILKMIDSVRFENITVHSSSVDVAKFFVELERYSL